MSIILAYLGDPRVRQCQSGSRGCHTHSDTPISPLPQEGQRHAKAISQWDPGCKLRTQMQRQCLQYGNLDEASAVARTPRKCLVIWCGDHKQMPGGLRKTDEAKAFRRKLLRRPIALRGNTEYLQPNMLGKVVLR